MQGSHLAETLGASAATQASSGLAATDNQGGPLARQSQPFEVWAILEIMGRQRFAGYITEETIAGASMLRLDVPAVDGLPAFTRLFSAASVYAITPVTEQLAREVAEGLKQQPMAIYDLPQSMQDKIRSNPPRIAHVDDDGDEHY